MNMISILLGDDSGDGHGKCHIAHINSSHTVDELKEFALKGAKKAGIHWSDICADYEDNMISSEIMQKLEKAGINHHKWVDKYSYTSYQEDPYEGYTCWIDDYINLWIELVKLGNPECVIDVVKIPKIDIGGYGLFF
jgi:hypothetical protein